MAVTRSSDVLNIQNAVVYKGVIDCSANPNYPAANAGHSYVVSGAGKIGGASGTDVEVGDQLICNTDNSPAGDQATVGANWGILQASVDWTAVLIAGGSIENVVIGESNPALSLVSNYVEISAGTMNNVIIGATSGAELTAFSVASSTATCDTVNGTNVNATTLLTAAAGSVAALVSTSAVIDTVDTLTVNATNGTISSLLTAAAGSIAAIVATDMTVTNLTQANIVATSVSSNYATLGSSQIGTSTNYFYANSAGETEWVGESTGVQYGDMAVVTSCLLTIDSQTRVHTIFTTASDGWVAGELHGVTFPAAWYLLIGKGGRYLVNWSLSIAQNSPAAAVQTEQGILINMNSAAGGSAHRTLSNSTDLGNSGGCTIQDLAAGDTLAMYLVNKTNETNIDVDHANLTINMVGGT